MGFYRPLGEWHPCWCVDGKEHCGECGHVIDTCAQCSGTGFYLSKVWVREPGDPPPADPSKLMHEFADALFKGAQETAARMRERFK